MSSTLPSTTLQQLADLAEIRGSFAEAGDLRRAALAIDEKSAGAQAQLIRRAKRDRLADEPGISPTIEWKVREVLLGGADLALRAARTGVPALVRRLIELAAVTTSEAATLVRHAGVLTLADLHAALDDGRVAPLLRRPNDARLRSAAKALSLEFRPLSLGRATDMSDALVAAIAGTVPHIDRLTVAGDARRVEPLVSTIAIVAAAPDPPAALEALAVMRGIDDVVHRSARRAILVYQQTEIDVRIAAPDEFGTVLFNATGSRQHVKALVARRGRAALCPSEEDVYRDAGLPYIAPELRNGQGEIEAAAAGRLPRLVERAHIRGDLHMHSTYSDGRDDLETMVATCRTLGYEYIAITDHSERAAASRTVTADDLARQRDHIARLRERYLEMAILHGVEADIMPDGGLDFPEAVLEPLDIVLASLHDAARQDGRALTTRCLQAIHNPLVNVVTHPANRLVGRHGGYALDYDAIYAAAAETGTALEIDGAPAHLDLDGEHARAAVAAGVTVAIDSDCHRALWLDRQMRFGIGTARRGWVEPRHVLNAKPLSDVRAFIAAKRARR